MTGSGTVLSIDGERFLLNGRPTYAGRQYHGRNVEGLLFGVRAAQATFDDENWPHIRSYDAGTGPRSFAYPDSGHWDPDRNVEEFCTAVPVWKAHGISVVCLAFQGGRPVKDVWKMRADAQPWVNVAFESDGRLKKAYARRMEKAIAAVDAAGMAAVVSFFYFGQSPRLESEEAVRRAVKEGTEFLAGCGHRNLIIEIAQEVTFDWTYYHYLQFRSLATERVHELIGYAQSVCERRIPVSTSVLGPQMPSGKLVESVDVLLPHGNGLGPLGHAEKVKTLREMPEYRANPKPIFFNEASAELPDFQAAFEQGVSWTFYDHGSNDYVNGFQSPPVNWGINTYTKKCYFERVRDITGV